MLNQKFIDELKDYINNNIISVNSIYNSLELFKSNYDNQEIQSSIIFQDIEDYIDNNRKPVLNQILFNLIDKRGVTDAEVYNKAGLDRKLFSKIRTNPDYKPRKNTIVSLAFALKLNQDEFTNLLESAGYSLSSSDTQDLIIKFFLEKNRYDIDELIEAFEIFTPKKSKKKAEDQTLNNKILIETLKTITELQLNKHKKSDLFNAECLTRQAHHRRKNVIGDIRPNGSYFTLYKNGAWTSRNKLGIYTIEQAMKHIKLDIEFLSR
ncbi:hypothetical protein RFW18_15775 [Metabacillus idriensis]|uniref:hypothetical protein n=1 Tax=Metabacillus idriensis TaxID=324768 RepID=UPI002814279A|nr:hypothetical protein [Metabacillus idriensis]MDR0139212.1 hypothetical protein [Metabacillus idriensis]